MPSPILARADALMQRRHLATADSEEVPVLTDAIDIDDDIPVLVDIAAPAAADETETPAAPPPVEAAAPAPAVAEDRAVPPIDAEWGAALVEELGRRVEQRLLAEIPRIVATAVSELLAEQAKAGDPQR